MAKPRTARPFKSPVGTLTEAGAREIRRRRGEGWTLKKIAAHVGVSVQAVWNLLNGRTKTWLK